MERRKKACKALKRLKINKEKDNILKDPSFFYSSAAKGPNGPAAADVYEYDHQLECFIGF